RGSAEVADEPARRLVVEVARRLPELRRLRKSDVDEGGDPRAALLSQPALGFSHQRSGNTLTPMLGADDESVEVPAPAVPAGDDGADQFALGLGQKQGAAGPCE